MDAQQGLDFTSPINERFALVRSLRRVPLEVIECECGEVVLDRPRKCGHKSGSPIVLSPGRVNGVVELLERLLVASKSAEADSVRAQVSWIAAGISGRHSVKERTVQNWSRDARALGLIEVDTRSHAFGGREWNRWSIVWSRVAELVTDRGVKRGETGCNGFVPRGRNEFVPRGRNEFVPSSSTIQAQTQAAAAKPQQRLPIQVPREKSPAADCWLAVELALRQTPIGAWKLILKELQNQWTRWKSPEEAAARALTVVEFWRSHHGTWPAGYLATALRADCPEKSIPDLFGPPLNGAAARDRDRKPNPEAVRSKVFRAMRGQPIEAIELAVNRELERLGVTDGCQQVR